MCVITTPKTKLLIKPFTTSPQKLTPPDICDQKAPESTPIRITLINHPPKIPIDENNALKTGTAIGAPEGAVRGGLLLQWS